MSRPGSREPRAAGVWCWTWMGKCKLGGLVDLHVAPGSDRLRPERREAADDAGDAELHQNMRVATPTYAERI